MGHKELFQHAKYPPGNPAQKSRRFGVEYRVKLAAQEKYPALLPKDWTLRSSFRTEAEAEKFLERRWAVVSDFDYRMKPRS